MNTSEDLLLARIKEALLASDPPFLEPLSDEELDQAEEQLGFPLPSLLREIYQINDGEILDFLPLEWTDLMGNSVLTTYADLRSAESGIWPEKLLAICDHGCGMYTCLDCSKPECPVIRYDGDRSHDHFAVEARSFQQWLQGILDESLHFEWDHAEIVTFN